MVKSAKDIQTTLDQIIADSKHVSSYSLSFAFVEKKGKERNITDNRALGKRSPIGGDVPQQGTIGSICRRFCLSRLGGNAIGISW